MMGKGMHDQQLDLTECPDWIRSFIAQARNGTLPPMAAPESFAFKELGFETYAGYLESKLWKKIRRRVLKRDANKCRRCGGKADSVHHSAYTVDVLNGLADHLLMSVCVGCHTFIELDDSGNPRSSQETERLIDEHDPQGYPTPVLKKVGARKREVATPPEWARLSHVQRLNWFRAALKMGKTVRFPARGFSRRKDR